MTNQNLIVSLDRIAQLYKQGVDGSETAVQEAHRQLEQLRREHRGHPLADAYHGAVMILIARDRTKPLEKLRWSKAGLKLLDSAARAAPGDAMIRLLRGKAAYKLPEKHFHRTRTAIEDFTYLLDQRARGIVSFTVQEYETMTYELGDAYERIGHNQDAAVRWQQLAAQTANPSLRQLAEERLRAVAGKPPVEQIAESGTPSAVLIGVAARATGGALLNWVERERKKEEERKKKKKKKRRR